MMIGELVIIRCRDAGIHFREVLPQPEIRRRNEVIHKLRKLKGFCPMTPEEADAAYDAAPADPISEDNIDSMIEFVTSGGHNKARGDK